MKNKTVCSILESFSELGKSLQGVLDVEFRYTKHCNNEFPSSNDLMKHRKCDHPDNVSPCKNYVLGNCRRSNNDCWYQHGQLPTPAQHVVRQILPNISSRQDFPEAPILDQRMGKQTQTKQVLIMLQQQQQKQNQQMDIVMNQLAQLMK